MNENQTCPPHHHGADVSATRLVITILLNFCISAVQIAGGILSNSLSLVSDSLHNLSDGLAVLISFLALRIGKRESDMRRTYGYKRAEILAALLNTSIMVALSYFLIREAIHRLQQPEPVNSPLMMAVATFGLMANLAAVALLHRDSKKNLNIRAAYLHLMADTLSSVVVIGSGILIYFFKIYSADPIATVLIALYVLRESWQVLRESVDILMQAVPRDIDILKIKQRLETLPEVQNIHDVHIWKISDHEISFEGHVDIADDLKVSEFDQIRKRIETILHDEFRIEHTTIQVEYRVCEDTDLVRRTSRQRQRP